MPEWAERMGSQPTEGPSYSPPFRPAPQEDTSEPPIEEGPQQPASLGGEVQLDKRSTEVAVAQSSTAESSTSELRAHAGRHLASPDQVHVNYHVVLTEERGNADWRPRTIAVGTQPVRILGLDQNRRRCIITMVANTSDGEFVALGREGELAPDNYSAGNGTPPVNAYLISTSLPSIEFKHVREIWAMFVPDPTKSNSGQTAYLSILSEFGDAGLAHVVPKD